MPIDRTVPARNAETITPGDSGSGAANGEVANCRMLFIGGAGDIKFDMKNVGTAITLTVPAGISLPIEVTRVYDTDTDATNIVAFW